MEAKVLKERIIIPPNVYQKNRLDDLVKDPTSLAWLWASLDTVDVENIMNRSVNLLWENQRYLCLLMDLTSIETGQDAIIHVTQILNLLG